MKIEVLKQKFKEVFFIVLESLQLERESLKVLYEIFIIRLP